MHDKVHSLGDSNELVYGHGAALVLPRLLEPPRDPTGHGRAYLTLAKVGDVRQKLSVYENRQDRDDGGSANLKSLPNIDLNFIRNRATDTSRVVRKAQEVPDVNLIKNRLLSNNKEKDLFDYCGALLTKTKLKHFCKRMGHSKILGRMAALQKTGAQSQDDAGFRALNSRAEAETEYISRYRSGEVQTKCGVFEPRSNVAAPPSSPPVVQPPAFSWSLR